MHLRNMNPYVATALGNWRSKLHITPAVPLSNAPRSNQSRLQSSAGACGVLAGSLVGSSGGRQREPCVSADQSPEPCTAPGMVTGATGLACESLCWIRTQSCQTCCNRPAMLAVYACPPSQPTQFTRRHELLRHERGQRTRHIRACRGAAGWLISFPRPPPEAAPLAETSLAPLGGGCQVHAEHSHLCSRPACPSPGLPGRPQGACEACHLVMLSAAWSGSSLSLA